MPKDNLSISNIFKPVLYWISYEDEYNNGHFLGYFSNSNKAKAWKSRLCIGTNRFRHHGYTYDCTLSSQPFNRPEFGFWLAETQIGDNFDWANKESLFADNIINNEKRTYSVPSYIYEVQFLDNREEGNREITSHAGIYLTEQNAINAAKRHFIYVMNNFELSKDVRENIRSRMPHYIFYYKVDQNLPVEKFLEQQIWFSDDYDYPEKIKNVTNEIINTIKSEGEHQGFFL